MPVGHTCVTPITALCDRVTALYEAVTWSQGGPARTPIFGMRRCDDRQQSPRINNPPGGRRSLIPGAGGDADAQGFHFSPRWIFRNANFTEGDRNVANLLVSGLNRPNLPVPHEEPHD